MRPPRDDDDVVRFWSELGLPGLVDVHVHFMPERVLRKVWAYFDRVESLTGVPWPITYRADEPARLARLRSMGVRAFPALVYPHKPGMAAWLNDWGAAFADEHDDVLRTATLFPEPGVRQYVEQALAGGTRVVKVHLQVGAFDPRDPVLDEVWGLLADAGTPVVVHCGDGPLPGPFTGPGPWSEVMSRHPRLTAVVAHLGMPQYDAFLDLAGRYPRLHLDTTMAFTDFAEQRSPFPPDLRPRLLDLQDRVLLGSDFPNTPHPYSHQLEALARLDLGEGWLRAVLHDNASDLLGLSTPRP